MRFPQYDADSRHRAKEVVASFCFAGATLAFIVFATAFQCLVARAELETAQLAAPALRGPQPPQPT